MKQFFVSIAIKLLPENGKFRDSIKRIYSFLYPPKKDIIHRVITEKEQSMLHDAVRIGFVGDLILLRDMVENGKDGDNYNYNPMFESMRSYFSECDLMTGVLEGPLSGEELGYTTSNYGDRRDLKCGYPDSFLNAIKDSGINFVTVANNHLFDKGQAGMERTIAQLEKNSMPYVGYGSNVRTLIEVKDLRIAILAFNYGFNGKNEHFFFEQGNENLPHLIRPKSSRYYNRCLSQVKDDFNWAKSQNPHCIIVYPHIGTQFLHDPDKNQLYWFEIFKSLGADVILGCHSHATQPLRFEDGTLCLYCPGNFVNNYFPHDGDSSAMVEIYLDKHTGKPFASSIIPIWAYGNRHGLICAKPMYEVAHNKDLSWHEWFRLKDAHTVVTGSMLGIPIPIDQSQRRFVIWGDNLYRRYPYKIDNMSHEKQGLSIPQVFKDISKVVFLGDSITEGTKNGGFGWFEPMMASLPDKDVVRMAKGGATSQSLLELFEKSISETSADIFCIAIGCNDIRYRDEAVCAMSAAEYIVNISKIVSLIRENNFDATVILIAPWWSDDVFDKFCHVNIEIKHTLYDSYTTALDEFAKKSDCLFVNPNKEIWRIIKAGCQSEYLIDWIHPNASEGIRLFSDAFVHELLKLQ